MYEHLKIYDAEGWSLRIVIPSTFNLQLFCLADLYDNANRIPDDIYHWLKHLFLHGVSMVEFVQEHEYNKLKYKYIV